MMKSILIESLNFSYTKHNCVFKNFSLSIKAPSNKGKVYVLMGASGSGKTTLLKLLLGIEKPNAGLINVFPQKPVISYVPQEPVLFEHLSVEMNARYFQFAGINKESFNETLYQELVAILDLNYVIYKKNSVTDLSGGQRQRLSLLRALSINPQFVLLDEPTNGLDAEVKLSFLNKLREVTERYGLFILYVTHHRLEAQLIGDEVTYLLQDKISREVTGQLTGPVVNFINEPPVLDAAKIFRFPDIKILPLIKSANNSLEIVNGEKATVYWLMNEESIEITDKGWPFIIISKSSVYTVIRDEGAHVEWIINSTQMNNYNIGDRINVSVRNYLEYDKSGILIKSM